MQTVKYLAVLWLASCATSSQLAHLQQQQAATQAQLEAEQRKNEAAHEALDEQVKFEVRKIWGKLYCDNQQVREFIKACENSDAASCSEQALGQALAFMGSQPWVSFWMRPGSTGKEVHSVRLGQLAQLTDLRHTHPSTRYVVLVQPVGDEDSQQRSALHVGKEVIKLLRNDFGVTAKAMSLGVRMLPCRMKSDQLKQYTRAVDQPKLGEPRSDEPRVRVWLFRTDC